MVSLLFFKQVQVSDMQSVSSKLTGYVYTVVAVSLLLRLFFIGQYDLLAEEAYYWNYATHLDFGYLDHPPMVAVLIKLFIMLFGTHEFAVRCPAILCWGIATYYSYRWCELIQIGSGRFAVLLLSILPFFFLSSAVMTPDLPLIAAWSAALYYLYRAICLGQRSMWYWAGVAVGLGCLSKYTMVLVIGTTALYLLTSANTRRWLGRKELYLAAGIILLLFSPVIYWNATHEWLSFTFQSTRRFHQSRIYFSLHEVLGLLVLFLTPIGILGLGRFFKKNERFQLDPASQWFMQCYTLVPLLFFGAVSLTHGTKWNWIGPGLLALIPWLALCMAHQESWVRQWLKTGYILIFAYSVLFFCTTFGQPVFLNYVLLGKMISWEKLTQDFYQIATEEAKNSGKEVIFIPLERYTIASELAFYQAKQTQSHAQRKPYLINSPAEFGMSGLMFDLWADYDLKNKTIVFIGLIPDVFDTTPTEPLSPIKKIWAQSQGYGAHIRPIYYRVVQNF